MPPSVARTSNTSGHTSRRMTRLDLRLSEDYKALLQRAADLRGETLTEFVVSASAIAANQALQEEQVIRLSKRDQELFVHTLLSNAPPGKRLRAAAARYRKIIQRS